MEIVIGAVPQTGSPNRRIKTKGAGVEARMLSVRPTRRKNGFLSYGTTEKRGRTKLPDPVGGRVLTLIVPDGLKLPSDLSSEKYRVFLRFAQK